MENLVAFLIFLIILIMFAIKVGDIGRQLDRIEKILTDKEKDDIL